ncbi:MAG: class I SAM-dependent methyltransferase [Chloroflexota bacterium]
MEKFEPTKRFTNRAKNYVKFRPSYPTAVYECLQAECGLDKTAVIADIGSGTGLFTELFLKQGNVVHGIEPNRGMREAGEFYLKKYAKFKSVNGTAEKTTLPANSVDFIVAGQAAHWFELQSARREFVRILKLGGTIALSWNRFDTNGSAFMKAYEEFYGRFSTLKPEDNTHGPTDIPTILMGKGYQRRIFPNPRRINFENFEGGVLSSSVMPLENPELRPAIRDLFEKFVENGEVELLNQSHLLFKIQK